MGPASSSKEHKSRLGRGLSSLLSEPVPVSPPKAIESSVRATPVGPAESSLELDEKPMPAEAADRVQLIELGHLTPSPFQPRREFDATSLAELAASIKTAGVMQPILARTGEKGLEIIAGERRWRAARDAGLTHVPVLVRTLTDQETAEWSLVENLQREDLNAADRSTALRRLATDFGLSHGAIAERVGLDRSTVTNLIRLGELEKEILSLLSSGELSAGHGKALLALAPGATRIKLAQRAAKEGLSVRHLERISSDTSVKRGKRAHPASKSSAVIDMEHQLRDHLGTDVSIDARGDGKRGTISIAFYDLDHFDRLLKSLGVTGRMM